MAPNRNKTEVLEGGDPDAITQAIDERAGLVAKIKKSSALDDIKAIMAQSDTIMVARGDLCVELPPKEVPPILPAKQGST